MRRIIPALLTAALLSGCVALGGIEEIGPNEYRIGVEATTDAEAAAVAEAAALDEAAAFCQSQGRRMTRSLAETDSLSIRTTHGAYSNGDTTLTFRCE